MRKIWHILLFIVIVFNESNAQGLFIEKKTVMTFNCDTIFDSAKIYKYSPFAEFKYNTKSQTIGNVTYYCSEFKESSYNIGYSWFFYQNNQLNTLISIDTILDDKKDYKFSTFLNFDETVGNKWLYLGGNFFYGYVFELKKKIIDTTNHDILYFIELNRKFKVSDQDNFTSIVVSKNNGIIKLGLSIGHLNGELIECNGKW